MVGAGMGISIVPEMVIEKNSPCRYLPIAEEQAVRSIGTVVLRGRPLTRAHLVFQPQATWNALTAKLESTLQD
jgi:DNA-binding transcriptional LysR family regulator